ncbi:MAG: tyrosine-type recombinase/integrase [Clostridiales bacterium]|uniref:tyrosine-type recombinase/integrase n=1 Tax=Terrisporobacter sp. TaxID=1965305 RepID=UPI001C14D708|nr:tyrosine-type recombinase/integrase [Terrisporobacter sp.]MDD7757269.1 tyrosine-type recombinase/integrase [Clostridiales bacterium]HBF8531497.1 site-specific integrase [Clostridioides difficile]MDY4137187.1 tyrosine-type recombinase/integrase [Terrisporobacter sp.]HBF8533236.1 site-specific integrase [Clostridioides difficile]HBH2198376.1 site-specific integrase [Clostridioides difficile]
MSYEDLIKVEDIFDTKSKLKAHAEYYQKKDIDGLHYVYHDRDTNTIAICHPNHRTHHLATTYLLRIKKRESVNTVRRHAYALKKFLDFQLVWDIDFKKADLLHLLEGFVGYLRCIDIDPAPKFQRADFFYSSLKKIPLNNSALSCGKVISIGYNKDGFMKSENWTSNSYNAIKSIVSVAVSYLTFLQEKTKEFEVIDLNTLPKKRVKTKHSLLSGTLGQGNIYKTDIDYILCDSGFKKPKKVPFGSCVDNDVLSLEEVDMLINAIPENNYQNRLLFTILKCFGLRAGEACNLEIDTSDLPPKFIFMDRGELIEVLKEKLKGDIRFSEKKGKWLCCVNEGDSDGRFDSQSKTGARIVPLVIPNSDFEECLCSAIVQRDIIMAIENVNHNKLFIKTSQKDGVRGEPINGASVNDRFSYLAKKIKNNTGYDLTYFSPHSIRHFYATHLISKLKYPVFDVSKFLGHSTIDITIKTYYHFIDSKRLDNETKKMYEKFKEKEMNINDSSTI